MFDDCQVTMVLMLGPLTLYLEIGVSMLAHCRFLLVFFSFFELFIRAPGQFLAFICEVQHFYVVSYYVVR